MDDAKTKHRSGGSPLRDVVSGCVTSEEVAWRMSCEACEELRYQR